MLSPRAVAVAVTETVVKFLNEARVFGGLITIESTVDRLQTTMVKDERDNATSVLSAKGMAAVVGAIVAVAFGLWATIVGGV